MTRLGLSLLALAASVPAAAVGLGPLSRSGITDGPAKAFYLTVMNPYAGPVGFRAYAIGSDDEGPQSRVQVFPDRVRLAGGSQRRILVVAKNLARGETYAFRVCAEREQQTGGMINARVCSKLSARRLGPAA